jgi:hypothetical protein
MTRRGTYGASREPLDEGREGQPARTAGTGQGRPFASSVEDEAWYVKASAAGLFRPSRPSDPHIHYPGKGRPPSKWGKAIRNFELNWPGEPLPGPQS